MKYFSNSLCTCIFAVCSLTACGGGGGSSNGSTTNPASSTGFSAADFSEKFIYYTSSTQYTLARFYADGSVQSSNLLSSGTPVLNAEKALWAVSGGDLLISFAGETQRYTPISNDLINRSFRVTKTSGNGTLSTIRFFYDQTTGLAQAQAFVISNQTP